MADPASLNASLAFEGLSLDEGQVAFANLPEGTVANVRVIKPALGPKRYAIDVEGLSIKGANDVTSALLRFMTAVADELGDGFPVRHD